MVHPGTKQAPFFIIGGPRSGTTLLRLMLTCHPYLVVPPECGFVVWLHGDYGHWGQEEFSNREQVKAFAERVFNTRKFPTWGISASTIESALLGQKIDGYASACEAIYRIYAVLQGKADAMWGDKNNFHIHCIDRIREIYPGAKFIHIVRDGRDVACSYRDVMSRGSSGKYHPRLPVDVREIAHTWVRDLHAARAATAAVPPARKIQLRYEDLVANPRPELSRICQWLGVTFVPDMLEFHRYNAALRLEPWETMPWKEKTLRPVQETSVGRYLKLLSEAEVATFESIADKQLSEYGYK